MRVLSFAVFFPCLLAAQNPAKMAIGSYECWAYSTPRLLLNFTIKNGSAYTDSDGKPGTYTYDAKTGRVTFKGGMLDGAMPDGFLAIYHEKDGKPTLSYRGRSGAEASFCEKVK